MGENTVMDSAAPHSFMKPLFNIELRPATSEDAKLLFDWRNDPDTRSASHNADELVFSEHLRWLASTLSNSKRKLYIAFLDGMPIGTVRADGDDVGYKLSWTIAPQSRAKGLGSAMVIALARMLRAPVRAEIKKENTPSIKIAEAAGMRFHHEENGVMHFRSSPGG